MADVEPVADREPLPLVTMATIVDWSFDEFEYTEERVAKLEWGAVRQLLADARDGDLVAPFAWLFERLSTARPEAARSVARAVRAHEFPPRVRRDGAAPTE